MFDRAIMMSGCAPVLGPITSTIVEKAWEEMCSSLNVASLPISKKLEKLRALDPTTILNNYTKAPMGPMADGIYLPLRWDPFSSHQKKTRCKSIILGDTKHDGVIVDYISTSIPQPIFLSLLTRNIPTSTLYPFLTKYFAISPNEELSSEAYKKATRTFFSTFIFQYPNLLLARSFPEKHKYLYHFDVPSSLPGPMKGLSYHGQCATFLWGNTHDSLPASHNEIGHEMRKFWIRFICGKSRIWERFEEGRKERWLSFGGQGKGMRHGRGWVVTDRVGDESREFGWLGWCDGHREVVGEVFRCVLEMIECGLLRQGEVEREVEEG